MENMDYQEEDTQHGRYLTFALGDEAFGLEIGNVTEIVGIQPVTPIPEVPSTSRASSTCAAKSYPS